MTLRIGWVLDFIDKPADGLVFNFWSGSGDLTLKIDGSEVTYKGTNGVIEINPPNEAANESVRLTAKMDASDPSIRAQMRRDFGLLKIRLRWVYYQPPDPNAVGNDGITPFTPFVHYWSDPTNTIILTSADNPFENGEVAPVRFRSVQSGVGLEKGTTYYARARTDIYSSQGWTILSLFDSEESAESTTKHPFASPPDPGRVAFSGDGTGLVFGRFDPAVVVETGKGKWVLSSKQFIGRLGAPVLSGATYTIEVESLMSDLDRGRIQMWSKDAHLRKYPGDKSFEFIKEYKDGIDTKWPP